MPWHCAKRSASTNGSSSDCAADGASLFGLCLCRARFAAAGPGTGAGEVDGETALVSGCGPFLGPNFRFATVFVGADFTVGEVGGARSCFLRSLKILCAR